MELNNNFPGSQKQERFPPAAHKLFSSTSDALHQQYDSGIINAVWEKAIKEFGFYYFRRDLSGKVIAKQEFGKKTQYGWEIVHIIPLSNGGSDDIENLEPLHWELAQKKGER